MIKGISVTQMIWQAAGFDLPSDSEEVCWLCGGQVFDPIPVTEWVKPTFTDWRDTHGSEWICAACVWATSDRNAELAARLCKPGTQRMRNYSHFLAGGDWIPLSKGHKRGMSDRLLSAGGLPEVAVVAESGQKHLVFKARANPPGQMAGWVLFEESRVWVKQPELRETLALVEALYAAGHSKMAISSGQYHLRPDADLDLWWHCEETLRTLRGAPVFNLAVFLAQTREDDGGYIRDVGESVVRDLAGDRPGLQTPVRDDDLEAVRGPDPDGSRDYKQSSFLFDAD